MTNLLLQTDKLEILSNEREFPVKDDHYEPGFVDDYNSALAEWKSTATRVTVHPGEVKKFLDWLISDYGYGEVDIKDFHSILRGGIVIPECFEVIEFEDDNWGQKPTMIKWAFFRSEATDPQEPKWIKVSDRLPDSGTEVLTYNIENGSMTVQYFDGHTFGYVATIEAHVTHWLPLPEAPKDNNN